MILKIDGYGKIKQLYEVDYSEERCKVLEKIGGVAKVDEYTYAVNEHTAHKHKLWRGHVRNWKTEDWIKEINSNN